MVNRTFKGRRFEWLLEQKPQYEEAVAKNTIPSFIDVVFARFCRRFPINMPLDEEPSTEFLAAIDDDAPEPEPEPEPMTENLTEEEKAAAIVAQRERQNLIRKRKKQVKNWYHYQFMKDHNLDPKSSNDNNPFGAVIAALTGQELFPRPRLKTAVNTWCKTDVIEINKVVQQTVVAEKTPPGKTVAVWNRVAKQLFNLLKPEEKKYWEKKAKENHEAALAEWKASRDKKIGTSPEARQKCIEGLVRFGQPIIEAMALATGFKVSLIAGGPEPADGGRLNVISLHAGTTNGDVKLNFGQKMRTQYLENILPVFSEFLKACYTTEECRARALSSSNTSDVDALDDMALDDMGATLDEARFTNEGGSTGDGTDSMTAANAAPPVTLTTKDTMSNNTTGNSDSPSQDASTPLNPSALSVAEGNESVPPARSLPPSPLPSPIPSRAASPSTADPPVVPLCSPIRSPTRRAASLGSVDTPRTIVSDRDIDTGINVTQPPCPSPIRSSVPGVPPAIPFVAPALRDDDNDEQDTVASRHGSPSVDDPPPAYSRAIPAQGGPSVIPEPARTHDTNTTSHLSGKRLAEASVDAPASKRLHVAPAPSTSSVAVARDPALLRKEISWFDRAISMMTEDSLGDQWSDLVAAWVAFEAKHQCRPNGALYAKGRPPAVGDWIQRARNPRWRPNIKDTRQYADTHVAWWRSLQPEWRTVDEDSALARQDDGDFEDLQRPGPNGLLSVLASLFFWGHAVKSAGKKSKRWDSCVDDLMYVLTCLSA